MSEVDDLKKKLAELQACIPSPTPTEPEDNVRDTFDMDEDDIIRLENLLLKERNSELERNIARNGFYSRLVEKYKIDLSAAELSVDFSSKKILLTPK